MMSFFWKLNEIQKKEIVKRLSKIIFLNPRGLVAYVVSTSGIMVTPETIRNIFHNLNIRGGVP